MNGKRTLIVGIGNELRGDDGAGAFVVQRIASLSIPGLEAMTVHQLLPEMALEISTATGVIFVDAISCVSDNDAPVCRRIDAAGSEPSRSHHLTPGQLLALTASTTGQRPEAWLMSIPVTRMGIGDELSETALRNSTEAIRMICDQCSERGIAADFGPQSLR